MVRYEYSFICQTGHLNIGFSLFSILGILYSYRLYLPKVRTGKWGAHLHILEEKSQVCPTPASWSYLCCAQRRCCRFSVAAEQSLPARWSWLQRVARQRAEVVPSSQNVSSYQSISLQFCLCRVYSRYTDTWHATDENLHAAGCISKFTHVFALEKHLFFLHVTSLSKSLLPLPSIRADDTAFIRAEKREGLHSHMDATTPWDSCVCHPASAYGWISPQHLYRCH